ncbi:MAG: hypothetical protein U9O87_01465 [Verrucomicrobiota bacterium]|nr:hypothetical protein [Verrucomicrobiota bacterium]
MKKTRENNCPSSEELSAWFDGESPLDFSEHLNTCTTCAKKIKDYKHIENLFANVEVAKDLADKIIEASHNTTLDKTPSKNNPFWILSKIAAIIMLLLSIIYIGTELSNKTQIAEDISPEKKPKILVAKATEVEKEIRAIKKYSQPTSSIKSDSITAVAFGNNGGEIGLPASFEDLEESNSFKHIWMVDSLDKAERIISELKLSKNDFRIIKDNASLEVALKLNLAQAEYLINSFSRENFKLVKAYGLSPKQLSRMKIIKPLFYKIVFIKQ